MGQRIRIEIKGKDEFWERAFHVEWEDQFPERRLAADGEGQYLVNVEWMSDLEKVGEQTFCRIMRAPDNPRRREWFNSLLSKRSRN